MKKRFRDNSFLPLTIFISFISIFLYKNIFVDSPKKSSLGDGFQNASPAESKHVCSLDEPGKDNCKSMFIDADNDFALLLGNSQLGAINQYNPVDKQYAHIVSELYSRKSDRQSSSVKSIWFPNATLTEFNEIYLKIVKCLGLHPRHLILPVFLDDMRTAESRDEIKKFLCVREVEVEEGGSSNYEDNTNTTQNSQMLAEKLKTKVPLFEDLQSINSHFRADLYKLRNTILGIKADTVRPVLPGPYKQNLNSLVSILNSRSNASLPTSIYIPPLLNSTSPTKKIPYKRDVYANFKQEIANTCKLFETCSIYNFESAVPDLLWGTKNSTSFGAGAQELDFMHFTGAGHVVFSRYILDIIK